MTSLCRTNRTKSALGCRRCWGAVASLVFLVSFLSSCATVGRDFPESRVAEIRIGKTTQDDVLKMFGSPWRVGIEDGLTTWTYGKYRYRLIGETNTKDLVIRFDAKNIVVSYTFNTTEHKK
jgi:outer membrane protein assembly factor BamE (lipoprotein component of BamABCDE complex)